MRSISGAGARGCVIHTLSSCVAQALHGKFLVHPVLGRKMPVICDAELVDMAFGTGAVKITPAHDPNDFATGKRHGLEFINILDDEGRMNANCGPFAGLKRFECRKKVVDFMRDKGLFRGTEDNAMAIPLCSRSKDVIEPILKPQASLRVPGGWGGVGTGQYMGLDDPGGPSKAVVVPAHSPPCAVRLCPAVVGGLQGHGGGRRAGGARRPPGDRSPRVRGHVVPVAGQHPGLVHLAAALVGPPHPGLLRPGRGRGPGRRGHALGGHEELGRGAQRGGGAGKGPGGQPGQGGARRAGDTARERVGRVRGARKRVGRAPVRATATATTDAPLAPPCDGLAGRGRA